MKTEKANDVTQQAYWRRPRAFSRVLAALFFVTSLVLFAQGRASAQRGPGQTTDTTLGQGIGTLVADAYGDGSNVRRGEYRACVEHTINPLSQQRLYDRRLGQ